MTSPATCFPLAATAHACPAAATHTHIRHLRGGAGSRRRFPNGKTHCKKLTVKPAAALSNYSTASAQMWPSLLTPRGNLRPSMTDGISLLRSTLSPLKVTQQHINFSQSHHFKCGDSPENQKTKMKWEPHFESFSWTPAKNAP